MRCNKGVFIVWTGRGVYPQAALPSTIEGKVNGNGGALSDSEGLASLEADEGAHYGLERAAEQFRIRRRHSWCSKILYYVVRTVDLSRGEGTRYEKRHGYTTLFLSGSESSVPEKA